MNEECGIVGYYSYVHSNKILDSAIRSLHKLQHRGREGSGVSFLNFTTKEFKLYKSEGLVKEVFADFDTNKICNTVIGHNRYSTSGKSTTVASPSNSSHLQPFHSSKYNFSLVHNGNIHNIDYSLNDTEFLVNFIENERENKIEYKDILIKLLNSIKGIYCLIIQTEHEMYLVRDRYGVRPFYYGKLLGDVYVCGSETVAFIDKTVDINQVNPGEIVKLDNNGFTSLYTLQATNPAFCLFEYLYFMDYNSQIKGEPIYNVRFKLGVKLAETEQFEFNKDSTYVIGSPNSGIPAGQGYAFHSKIEYKQYIQKKANLGRTFILPDNTQRIEKCKKGFEINEDIRDKDIIIIDDTIVRGNTITQLIEQVRNKGAKSVHVRIAAPPIKNPCNSGIDLPTHEELVAYQREEEDIRKKINADSIKFLDLSIIKEVTGDKLCTKFCPCFKNPDPMLEW